MEKICIGVNVPANLEFCRSILTGIRSYCSAKGIGMNILSETGLLPETGKATLKNLPPLAGIIAHVSDEKGFEALYDLSPFVVGTSNRWLSDQFPKVINDDKSIGRMGAEHLLSLGLRKLVFLNKKSMLYSRERWDGFAKRAESAGVKAESITFVRSAELAEIGKSLLQHPPPIGVMAESDNTARSFIEQLPDYRKAVPHRIAVIGVDDDSLQNAFSPVSLSTIKPNGYQIGLNAARMVFSLHTQRVPLPQPIRIQPIRVIERASTNVLAISDPVVAHAIRLMREKVSEFRDVEDVVSALGIQRRTLEKRFRKVYHRSIAAELTYARLNAARSLLATTNLSIAEISELVGYPEYRLLTIAFRRLTGEPPSAFRKRVQSV